MYIIYNFFMEVCFNLLDHILISSYINFTRVIIAGSIFFIYDNN